MNRFVWDAAIALLIVGLILLEYFLLRKAKPWMHLAFWAVGGFALTYYFSR